LKFKPDDRKAQILAEAVRQARFVGYQNIRRENVAKALGLSVGMVNHTFTTMALLKRAVMGAAIAQRIPEIVAQGLAAKDPRAMNAPDDLKAAARATL